MKQAFAAICKDDLGRIVDTYMYVKRIWLNTNQVLEGFMNEADPIVVREITDRTIIRFQRNLDGTYAMRWIEGDSEVQDYTLELGDKDINFSCAQDYEPSYVLLGNYLLVEIVPISPRLRPPTS